MQVCPTVYMCFVYMEGCRVASQDVLLGVLWDNGVSGTLLRVIQSLTVTVVSNTLDSLFSIQQGGLLNQKIIYCFT